MHILKHQKTGRLFIATPALLKNKHMINASPEEAEAFIGCMDESRKETMEKAEATRAASLMMPADLDPKVDISSWGKPQLLGLASKIGLNIPPTLKVKEIRLHMQNTLNELAKKAVSEAKQTESEASEKDSGAE